MSFPNSSQDETREGQDRPAKQESPGNLNDASHVWEGAMATTQGHTDSVASEFEQGSAHDCPSSPRPDSSSSLIVCTSFVSK